jgi:RNA polymerase sigma-B factor
MSGPITQTRRSLRHDHLLLQRHFSRRDLATRDALVERYLPLARHLAGRFNGGGEQEDLVQVASLALLKAIDRFDPSRAIAFSSYAVPTIVGELKRYFRDHGWTVRVPRDVQELAVRMRGVSHELSAQLRRAPTPAELAQRCGVSVERVLEALAAGTAHRPDSLDRPRFDDDDGEGSTPVTCPAGEDPGLGRVEDVDAFESWLAFLPPRERSVLRLRFQHELRQWEIGERLGISQMQVSRMINRSLTTLHSARAATDRR